MKWEVYVTLNNGEGIPMMLMLWDTSKEKTLKLHLDAFAEDAVLTIEPYDEKKDEDC